MAPELSVARPLPTQEGDEAPGLVEGRGGLAHQLPLAVVEPTVVLGVGDEVEPGVVAGEAHVGVDGADALGVAGMAVGSPQ